MSAKRRAMKRANSGSLTSGAIGQLKQVRSTLDGIIKGGASSTSGKGAAPKSSPYDSEQMENLTGELRELVGYWKKTKSKSERTGLEKAMYPFVHDLWTLGHGEHASRILKTIKKPSEGIHRLFTP